ncbi:MAG TPA: hypothetical protein VNN17_10190 [Terriglobia bacterium]|nr:hypothetical protein [Terriglobia bacterium]
MSAISRKYTKSVQDFDLGTFFNTNDTTPPDQVQLNAVASTFPVMWVANAGEDTVSKIDTNTGATLARYRTWFSSSPVGGCVASHLGNAYASAAPSRTAVDGSGNVYVANRHFDNRPAEIVKILAEGFIDRNGNGVPDTSTGHADLKPIVDANADCIIQSNEISDERIAWVARVGPNNGLGRSLSIDGPGNLWLGLYNNGTYYKVSSVDGTVLDGPIPACDKDNPGFCNTPYGSLVDQNGTLWGASLSNTLFRMDTNNTADRDVYTHAGGDYGIAIGTQGGVVHAYQANYSGLTYTDFNSSTLTFSTPAAVSFSSLGIAVDGAGNIAVGNWGSGGFTKFTSAGAVICSAPNQAGTGEVRGVQIDSNQDVWLIHRTTANISKFDGDTCAPLGVFPVGDQPYTYTDATGIQRFTTTDRTGNWRVVQDSGLSTNVWQKIFWNTEPQASEPAGTEIAVEARTAATQAGLAAAVFGPVTNDGALCQAGRWIEVKANLSTTIDVSPVLSDITVVGKCDTNSDGIVNMTDINAINAARNTPAAGACDARDADSDGLITTNDSRACVVKCTKPRCQ